MVKVFGLLITFHAGRQLFYFPGLVNWSVLENKKLTFCASCMQPLSAQLRGAPHRSPMSLSIPRRSAVLRTAPRCCALFRFAPPLRAAPRCSALLRFALRRSAALHTAPLRCSAVLRTAPTTPHCCASLRTPLFLVPSRDKSRTTMLKVLQRGLDFFRP